MYLRLQFIYDATRAMRQLGKYTHSALLYLRHTVNRYLISWITIIATERKGVP